MWDVSNWKRHLFFKFEGIHQSWLFFVFAKAINHDFDRNINNFCLEGQSRTTALQPVTFVKNKGRLFYCFLYEGFLVSHQPYPTVRACRQYLATIRSHQTFTTISLVCICRINSWLREAISIQTLVKDRERTTQSHISWFYITFFSKKGDLH